MPLWPRPGLMVMLVSPFDSDLVRAGETERLEGAVERVAVVRVDWEVLLRTERRETDRREEAAELTWDERGEWTWEEGMAAAEGRLECGRAMTNGMRLMCAWGMPYSSPFYQRQAECGYRGGCGRGGGRRAVDAGAKQEGLLGWVAPGWAG